MKYWLSKSNKQGFTLIEILVVVAIVSLLSGVVAVSSIQSGQKSRDAKRQADLQALQSAVELYKNKNGRYPAGCNGANVWSGQLGTTHACTSGSTQYITNLAPEFIPVLPLDKKLNTSFANSGYVYVTNANGTVYKIMAMNTVESDTLNYNHEFKSCDIRPDSLGRIQNTANVDISGWCYRVATGPVTFENPASPVRCKMNTGPLNLDGGDGRFERSYGLWGGFEALTTGVATSSKARNTTSVICK